MEHSSALLAAQMRLLALRKAKAQNNVHVAPRAIAASATPTASGWLAPLVTSLHADSPPAVSTPASPPRSASPAPHATSVRLSPDIAAAALRANLAGATRLWLLLRHLDRQGSGMVTLAAAQAQLAERNAPLRICGARQLRNLLRAGHGRFWQRDRTRIWLYAPARVALALGVPRFDATLVELPVCDLLGSIGAARAALYATLHSARPAEQPIARATLAELTGLTANSQRAYEVQRGVTPRANYALLNGEAQELVWRHGRAIFTLVDRCGRHGVAGNVWQARQLPNSYHGPYARATRRAVRRLNRRLTDLLQLGTAGNGCQTLARRYCTTAAQALATARTQSRTTYFAAPQAGVWYALHV